MTAPGAPPSGRAGKETATAGNFTRYAGSVAAVNFADGIASVTWVWMASLLTRNPALIALASVAITVPWFLFAIPAGVLADRFSRKHILLLCDSSRMVLYSVACVALLVFAPGAEAQSRELVAPFLYMAMMALAFASGTMEVLRDTVAQAFTPLLVDPSTLDRANGRLLSIEITGQLLVGPVVGAICIGLFVALPFALNAALYLLSVLLIVALVAERQSALASTSGFTRQVREGWSAFKAVPGVAQLSVISALWNVVFGLVTTSLVLFAQERMGLSSAQFGFLMSLGAIGGICAGLAAPFLVRRFGSRAVTRTIFVFAIPTPVLIACSDHAFWIVSVGLALFLFPGPVWNTVSVSYRQRNVPEHVLGRVVSIHRLATSGALPIGAMLAGLTVLLAEEFWQRSIALAVPFMLASFLACVLGYLAYRRLSFLSE